MIKVKSLFSGQLPKDWKKKAITALMALFLLASFAAAVTSVVTNLASAQAEESSQCPVSIELHFPKNGSPACYDTSNKEIVFTLENGININVDGLIINAIGLEKAETLEDNQAKIKKGSPYYGRMKYDSKAAGPIRVMKITPKIIFNDNEQICMEQAVMVGRVMPCK